MQKTKLQIIDETVEYYNDATRRGVAMNTDGDTICKYLTPNGKTCAFGRCMIEPVDIACTVFGIEDQISSLVGKKVLFQDLLKEEYRGYELRFWKDIQELHDCESNFTGGTWSERGKKEIQRLKHVYGKVDSSSDS